jgi:hypothetical protein
LVKVASQSVTVLPPVAWLSMKSLVALSWVALLNRKFPLPGSESVVVEEKV